VDLRINPVDVTGGALCPITLAEARSQLPATKAGCAEVGYDARCADSFVEGLQAIDWSVEGEDSPG
jgi:hypothetical protein